MQLTGKNFIGKRRCGQGDQTFSGVNPATDELLAPPFHSATDEEVDQAVAAAEAAFDAYRQTSAEQRADFLEGAATEIENLGDALLERCTAETALPNGRLVGERGRTVGQLRLFASVIRQGSWVEARIDRAQPDRKPLAKPDVRRMLMPIGPVVVFGASNFPLAFSVAGGDTASALAAGCPVVVKAHPAHPGTCEMIARAILKAADATGMPDGVFSMVHGVSADVGAALVQHHLTAAVAFTGSLAAGRALFDLAAARPEPIPVFAEMGSVNPVFILPGALAQRGEAIAKGLVQSVTLGVGQFCTNPGVVAGLHGEALDAFVRQTAELIVAATPATMLHQGICNAYQAGLKRVLAVRGVQLAGESSTAAAGAQGRPTVLTAEGHAFLSHSELTEEVFGPSTLIVACDSPQQMQHVAAGLDGQLTATLHGTDDDLRQFAPLVRTLTRKAGRILFNGFPTGVEVCPSMHHGGPYPATTDAHYTSVGTAAIARFARPICYQNFPQASLPAELQDGNPRGVWRMVDGVMGK